ncbi:hypothetical protein [Butyrivibrio sp. JL13D10]
MCEDKKEGRKIRKICKEMIIAAGTFFDNYGDAFYWRWENRISGYYY